MKARVARIALVLPLLLSACSHKNHTQNQPPLAPPIEDTPLPAPNKAPANLPPSVITKPQPPVTEAPPAPKPEPTTPPKRTRKTSKPAQATAAPPAVAPQPPANTTPAVSALGDLSSGDAADNRQQTTNSINDVERGLNTINRKLNDQEQKTSAQIREFIRQARTALSSGDIDGAHTLAIKAKVLLGELNQ